MDSTDGCSDSKHITTGYTSNESGLLVKPGAKRKKVQDPAATGWFFTIYKYNNEDMARVTSDNVIKECKYYIVGNVMGALRAFIRLKKKKRVDQVINLIHPKILPEKPRKSDKQTREWCKEGGDFEEFGDTKNTEPINKVGPTMQKCVDELIGGRDYYDLLGDPELGEVAAKYARSIREIKSSKVSDMNKERIKEMFEAWKPRVWQKYFMNETGKEADGRTIHWVCDAKGNSGKTTLSKYFAVCCDGIYFENGKSADIKHCYSCQPIVVFDLSRSQEERFNYEVLESLKNGIMFSSKYDSTTKVFHSPHVIVFANWWPRKPGAISMDRWKCWRIDEIHNMEYDDGMQSDLDDFEKSVIVGEDVMTLV